MILVNQTAQPGIPRPPRPTCGWGGSHMTEPLQLRQSPGSTGRHVWVRTLRQAPRCPDEVRQTRLPRLHPMLVHAVAVTHQDACPVVDEGCKSLFGTAWM